MVEEAKTRSLIRASGALQEITADMQTDRQWNPPATGTNVAYEHLYDANPTITTTSNTVGYAYTANTLGLTRPT